MAEFPITKNPPFNPTIEQLTSLDRGAYDTFNPRYQALLDNDNYLKEKGERASHVTPIVLLASNWSVEMPCCQTVTVSGVTIKDNPVVSLHVPDNATSTTVKAWNKAFGMVDEGITSADKITFKCYNKKPTVDFTVAVKGV